MIILIRSVWLAITWALAMIVFLPLYAVGFLLVPIAVNTCVLEPYPSILKRKNTIVRYRNKVVDALIGNAEDGVFATWWTRKHKNWGSTILAWTWFMRNPLVNMRSWPVLGCVIDPAKVHSIGTTVESPTFDKPGWVLTWCGPYTGFVICTKWVKLWLGWKIKPEDYFGIADDDWRKYGVTATVLVRGKGH